MIHALGTGQTIGVAIAVGIVVAIVANFISTGRKDDA